MAVTSIPNSNLMTTVARDAVANGSLTAEQAQRAESLARSLATRDTQKAGGVQAGEAYEAVRGRVDAETRDLSPAEKEVFNAVYAQALSGVANGLAYLEGLDIEPSFAESDIKFDAGVRVVPSQHEALATRFSVPIPAFQGDVLVYPDAYPAGAKNDKGEDLSGKPYPEAGKALASWDGKPVTGPDGEAPRGVMFFNFKDNKWQGLQGTGDKILLFNQVSNEQGAQLQAHIDKLGGPSALGSPKAVEGLLAFAYSIGLRDRYDSDLVYAKKSLTTRQDNKLGVYAYGMHLRANELTQAVFVPGPAKMGVTPVGEDGAVFVKTVDPKTKAVGARHVKPDAFLETYLHADTSPLSLSDLPVVRPWAN